MKRELLFTVACVACGAGAAFSQTQTGEQPAVRPGPQQSSRAEQRQPAAQLQSQQSLRQNGASGECAKRMQQVSGGDFFSGQNAAYRRHLGVLSDLRDAAMQLQAQGLDEACLKVVEAMETAIASFQDGATAAAGAVKRGEITRPELEQRLVPLDASDMPIDTARLEGTDLYSMDGQDIGKVEGFLMARGKPTHMIVDHGGFWDIGDNEVAIPLDIVRWDPEWKTFFAPLTNEQLDDAPEYDESAWDANKNDQYYLGVRG